jgi:tetratricopeptide (TPR) repeat protein
VLIKAQQWGEAIEEYESALPLMRERYGPLHRAVGLAAVRLATACTRTGDLECAQRGVAEARRTLEASPRPDLELSQQVTNAALILAQEAGDEVTTQDLARQLLRLAILDEGPDSGSAHHARLNLAFMLADAHRYAEAEPLARSVEAAYRPPDHPEHSFAPAAATLLAGILREQGKADEALPLHERALAMDTARGSDDGSQINLRIEYAHSLLAAGRDDEALAQAEVALAAIERFGPRMAARAEVGFVVARALGPASERAVTEAEAAADTYGSMGPRYADELARVRRWLASGSASDPTR